MARTIRPAVESLEDRLTPSGMAGENVNVVALLTNAAAKYTNVAYQNIQKLSALNQSAQAVYQQAQSAGTIPSLASLESALSQARSIVARQHSAHNAMRLVDLADKQYQRYYHAHGVSFNDTQFRAWDHDFHAYDNWITTKAVPYINAMEAWLNSVL